MMVKKCDAFYLCLLMVYAGVGPVSAQNTGQEADKTADTLSQYDDCSDSDVDYENSGIPLTIDEKIARMDNAFYASLNKFDRCQTSTKNDSSSAASSSSSASAASSSAGGANSNDGKVRGTDGSGGKSSPGAMASTAVSGVAPPPPQGAESQPMQQQAQKSENTSGGTPTAQLSANGKAPDDIPPGDNDSILEAQIRAAATAETDPKRKKLLWNEYRRYKGLKIIDNNKGQ